MKLYIDADAFPNLLKQIVVKAIERHKLPTYVISNEPVYLGPSEYIEYIIVASGFDEADDCIIEMLDTEDLVITADIPLADRVLEKKALAIDHRGKQFAPGNIKQHLAMRNLMQDIRDQGEFTKGPPPFSKKDVHQFANQLSQILSRYKPV